MLLEPPPGQTVIAVSTATRLQRLLAFAGRVFTDHELGGDSWDPRMLRPSRSYSIRGRIPGIRGLRIQRQPNHNWR